MQRLGTVGIAGALLACLLGPATPSRASTEVARCEGRNPAGCSVVFVATLNLDSVRIRFIPGVLMVGRQETQIFEVGNPANQVNYVSTWLTGRIQIEGNTISPPYQLLAGHTYELITVPRNAATPVRAAAVVEI